MSTALPERAVVVGTGLMAPGIAAALAVAIPDVAIVGRNRQRADEATDLARGLAGHVGSAIHGGPLGASSFERVEIVVETIVEDAVVKADVLGRIAPWLPPDALVATNTSSLSVDALALSTDRPEAFAGLHFLNPAHATGVVEIVAGTDTVAATLARLEGLVEAMGKSPIRVRRDVPGFVWNRIQFAVIRECLHLLETGVADPASIDAAVADGLAPRWLAAGPLATADLGGTDTFRRVAEELFPALSVTSTVQAPLGGSRPFYRWDEDGREAIERLRRDALAAGARIGRERRELIPPAFDDRPSV